MAILQYTNQHEKAALLSLRMKERSSVIAEKNKAKAVASLKPIFMQGDGPPQKITERLYLSRGGRSSPRPSPSVGGRRRVLSTTSGERRHRPLQAHHRRGHEEGDTATRRLFEDIVLREEQHYWAFDDYVR
jgi:hypothetical protein